LSSDGHSTEFGHLYHRHAAQDRALLSPDTIPLDRMINPDAAVDSVDRSEPERLKGESLVGLAARIRTVNETRDLFDMIASANTDRRSELERFRRELMGELAVLGESLNKRSEDKDRGAVGLDDMITSANRDRRLELDKIRKELMGELEVIADKIEKLALSLTATPTSPPPSHSPLSSSPSHAASPLSSVRSTVTDDPVDNEGPQIPEGSPLHQTAPVPPHADRNDLKAQIEAYKKHFESLREKKQVDKDKLSIDKNEFSLDNDTLPEDYIPASTKSKKKKNKSKSHTTSFSQYLEQLSSSTDPRAMPTLANVGVQGQGGLDSAHSEHLADVRRKIDERKAEMKLKRETREQRIAAKSEARGNGISFENGKDS
jgi:hypothetical protein